jgi:hypothetical protein
MNGFGSSTLPGILWLGNIHTNTAGSRRIIPVPFRLSAVKSVFDGF